MIRSYVTTYDGTSRDWEEVAKTLKLTNIVRLKISVQAKFKPPDQARLAVGRDIDVVERPDSEERKEADPAICGAII